MRRFPSTPSLLRVFIMIRFWTLLNASSLSGLAAPSVSHLYHNHSSFSLLSMFTALILYSVTFVSFFFFTKIFLPYYLQRQNALPKLSERTPLSIILEASTLMVNICWGKSVYGIEIMWGISGFKCFTCQLGIYYSSIKKVHFPDIIWRSK